MKNDENNNENMNENNNENMNENMDNINDVDNDETALQALQNELEETQKSLDSNFIKEFLANVNEDESSLAIEDISKFLTLYEERKKEYIEKKLTPLIQKGTDLNEKVKAKKMQKHIDESISEFESKYPEADIKKLETFFNDELGSAKKKEISNSKSFLEFYEKLYTLYKEKNDIEKEVPDKMENKNGDFEEELDNDLPVKRA